MIKTSFVSESQKSLLVRIRKDMIHIEPKQLANFVSLLKFGTEKAKLSEFCFQLFENLYLDMM